MLARRIVCYRPAKDKRPAQSFVIWTDRLDLKAKKLVKMYVARWSIEVFFRHLKSNLRTVHFPTRSPIGVHNWLVVIALSIVFMLIMTSSESKGRIKSLGEQSFPFLSRWRQLEIQLMNEAFANRFDLCPWPPPD